MTDAETDGLMALTLPPEQSRGWPAEGTGSALTVHFADHVDLIDDPCNDDWVHADADGAGNSMRDDQQHPEDRDETNWINRGDKSNHPDELRVDQEMTDIDNVLDVSDSDWGDMDADAPQGAAQAPQTSCAHMGHAMR